MSAQFEGASDDLLFERQESNSENNHDDSNDFQDEGTSNDNDKIVVAAVGKIFITCSGCNRTFSAYSGVVKCKSCLAQDRVVSQHQVEDGNIF